MQLGFWASLEISLQTWVGILIARTSARFAWNAPVLQVMCPQDRGVFDRHEACAMGIRVIVGRGMAAFAAVALIVTASAAWAQSPGAPASLDVKAPIPEAFDYSMTTFGAKEGAPVVFALTQTPDGLLWCATPQGLFRFDGVRFKPDERVRKYIGRIASDRQGTIYISYEFGGAGRIIGGRYEDISAGLPQATLKKFAFDQAMNAWATTTIGVFEFINHRWQAVGASRGIPDNEIAGSIGTLPDGSIWVVDIRDPAKAWLKPPSSTNFQAISSHELWLPLFGVTPAEVPADLVSTFDDLLLGNTLSSNFARDRSNVVWRFGFERVGRFYVTTDHGARHLVNENEIPGLPAQSSFSGFFADRDGNIWLTSHKGLLRISENRLRSIFAKDSVRGMAIARGSRGDIWISSYEVPWLHYVNGVSTSMSLGKDVPDALFVDSSDRLWAVIFYVSGHRGDINHIDVLDPSGAASRIDLPASLTRTPVAIAENPTGGILLSSASGFYRYIDGNWISGIGRSDVPAKPALRLIPDEKGRLWMGWPDGDVALVGATSARVFPAKEVALGAIYAFSPHNEHVWIGGDNGIAVMQGNRVYPLWQTPDNPFKTVTGIVETPQHELWLNTASGLYRVAPDGVAQLLAGRSPKPELLELFNEEDGLQGPTPYFVPGPSLFQADDGRIWVARISGLNWLDPEHIPRNTTPAQAFIDSVTADDKLLPLVDGVLRVPPKTHNLRIDYTAPAPTMPDRMTFQYRLAGIDDTWQRAGTQRFASYTDPPPGMHAFKEIGRAHV